MRYKSEEARIGIYRIGNEYDKNYSVVVSYMN